MHAPTHAPTQVLHGGAFWRAVGACFACPRRTNWPRSRPC